MSQNLFFTVPITNQLIASLNLRKYDLVRAIKEVIELQASYQLMSNLALISQWLTESDNLVKKFTCLITQKLNIFRLFSLNDVISIIPEFLSNLNNYSGSYFFYEK